MYTPMIAMGLVGIMICIGMVLRAKVGFLKKVLMPVSIIAGLIGFIYMNLLNDYIPNTAAPVDFNLIVDVLFTFSFIAIGLNGANRKVNKKTDTQGGNNQKSEASVMMKGALGMGFVWSILFGLTAAVGYIIAYVLQLFGSSMDPFYAVLLPSGFCQGPGQAANMGMIFEQTYGYANGTMAGVTFAAFGFVAAFGLGVPLAKQGIKMGLGRYKSVINESVERGFFAKEEQRESLGKVTTHSGNIETVALHFALMGVAYIIALLMAAVVRLIPGIGETFANMTFLWGMFAAMIVKKILQKLKINYLLSDVLMGRMTGWMSDFIVVGAFMSIKMTVIGDWLVPIIIICIVEAVLTFGICYYFGRRLGSDYDFERVLGLYGICTGTAPSGVALVRMVDSRLETPVASELGMMNMFMLLSTPATIAVTLLGTKVITGTTAVAIMFGSCVVLLIIMKIFRLWGKYPTFNMKEGKISQSGETLNTDNERIQGFLRITEDTTGLVM